MDSLVGPDPGLARPPTGSDPITIPNNWFGEANGAGGLTVRGRCLDPDVRNQAPLPSAEDYGTTGSRRTQTESHRSP